MTRDWKPGDVAMVHGQVALVWDDDDTPRRSFVYTDAEGDPCSVWAYSVDARPLVVIDPDDRRQVERLRNETMRMLRDHLGNQAVDDLAFTECDLANALQAALREFADPKPPRPDEPTGFAAVVEDAEGSRWVNWRDPRATHAHSRPWVLEDDPDVGRAYAEIDAVRVLSEGVR